MAQMPLAITANIIRVCIHPLSHILSQRIEERTLQYKVTRPDAAYSGRVGMSDDVMRKYFAFMPAHTLSPFVAL